MTIHSLQRPPDDEGRPRVAASPTAATLLRMSGAVPDASGALRSPRLRTSIRRNWVLATVRRAA